MKKARVKGFFPGEALKSALGWEAPSSPGGTGLVGKKFLETVLPGYGSGTRERAQRRRGGGDCLIKTQICANSKEEVYGLIPAHLLVS